MGSDADKTIERLWRIVVNVQKNSAPPKPVGRPNLGSTLFVLQLAEAARTREMFFEQIGKATALQHWAERASDEEITYLVWLSRKHLPSAT